MERKKFSFKVGGEVYEVDIPFSFEFWKWLIDRFFTKKADAVVDMTSTFLGDIVENSYVIIAFLLKKSEKEILEKASIEELAEFNTAFFDQITEEIKENPFFLKLLQLRILKLGVEAGLTQEWVEKRLEEIKKNLGEIKKIGGGS